MAEAKFVSCNICGSNDCAVLYETCNPTEPGKEQIYRITDHNMEGLALKIVKCRKCGLIYVNPRFFADDLLSNYKNMVDELYVEEEKGRRLSAQSVLKTLNEFKKSGRLLDIGCATGFLLDEARKVGWDIFGVEPSKWAVDYAREKLGIKTVFQGTLINASYPDNYFDVVVMKDVIEHLADPKDALMRVGRVLKSGGILCVNTPNIDSIISKILKARWWGVKQLHLYYFTRRTLYAILKESGFAPIKSKSHARVFTLGYWAAKIKGYNENLCRFFMFLIKIRIIKNNLLSIDLKDQIEVYAIKIR